MTLGKLVPETLASETDPSARLRAAVRKDRQDELTDAERDLQELASGLGVETSALAGTPAGQRRHRAALGYSEIVRTDVVKSGQVAE